MNALTAPAPPRDPSALRRVLTPQMRGLLLMAAAALALAQVASDGVMMVALIAFAMTLAIVALIAGSLRAMHYENSRQTMDIIADFIRMDPVAAVITDEGGQIVAANRAARSALHVAEGQTLEEALAFRIADPERTLAALRLRLVHGMAEEDMVGPGLDWRILAHRLGPHHILWRLPLDSAPEDAEAEGKIPMCMVGRNGLILSMNPAARRIFGGRPGTVEDLPAGLDLSDGAVSQVSTALGQIALRTTRLDAGLGRQELLFLPAERLSAMPDDGALAFEEAPIALIKLATDGTIREANREARTLLGCQDLRDTSVADYFCGLSRPVEAWLKEAARPTPDLVTEFLRLSRADTETYAQVTLKRHQKGNETVLVGVITDATELKSLEAQFVQSQKMQAIGQLAGGVAHDFNNLLTAISGHCDLLLLRHDQGDPDYADLIQINQNANRAAALVSQLLAFSRKQTLNPESLDLRTTLADLTHLLNRLVGEKIRLRLVHGPDLPRVQVDKRQLEQVMMNLVVNARDAMPEGGEVRINTGLISLDKPWKRAGVTVGPGEYVSIAVSDDGIGIAPDRLETIFEPFYTTKRTGEGTGLGLSTVYGIVKQTGGSIYVDSVPGSGSTFTVLFRVDTSPPRGPAKAKPAAVTRLLPGEGVVLLVEDEAPVRAFASRALRLRGYTVLEAEHGEQALSVLEDQSLTVDVAVTDVIMPGMNGPEWVRRALQTRPDMRVVFVSGYPEDAFEGEDEGIEGAVFLPKPFSLGDLTATVQQVLTGPQEAE